MIIVLFRLILIFSFAPPPFAPQSKILATPPGIGCVCKSGHRVSEKYAQESFRNSGILLHNIYNNNWRTGFPLLRLVAHERRIKNIIPITGVRISVCRGLRNEIKMYFIRFDKIVTIEMSKLSEYIIPRRETYL